jgi:hypothetical protein
VSAGSVVRLSAQIQVGSCGRIPKSATKGRVNDRVYPADGVALEQKASPCDEALGFRHLAGPVVEGILERRAQGPLDLSCPTCFDAKRRCGSLAKDSHAVKPQYGSFVNQFVVSRRGC